MPFLRQGIDKTNKLSCDLTLDYERSTYHFAATGTFISCKLPSSDTVAATEADSSYFWIPMGSILKENKQYHVIIKKEHRQDEDSKNLTLSNPLLPGVIAYQKYAITSNFLWVILQFC